MNLSNEMKRILGMAPVQVRPTDSYLMKQAVKELMAMGLVQLSYPTRLSALMQVPMMTLSSAGIDVVPPTVKGK